MSSRAIEFCKELQRSAGVNGRVNFIRGDAFDLLAAGFAISEGIFGLKSRHRELLYRVSELAKNEGPTQRA